MQLKLSLIPDFSVFFQKANRQRYLFLNFFKQKKRFLFMVMSSISSGSITIWVKVKGFFVKDFVMDIIKFLPYKSTKVRLIPDNSPFARYKIELIT